jgi:hypothetical protein
MRPTIYGNPIILTKQVTREEVISKFEVYFYDRIEKDSKFKDAVYRLFGVRFIYCVCAPKACHGNIYIKYLESLKNG